MGSPPHGEASEGRPLREPDVEGSPARDQGLRSARETSSLPSGVFKSGSPRVESVLAGAVGEIFLRHMARVERQAGEVPTPHQVHPEIERRNKVDPAELDALLADLRSRSAIAAPSVSEDLVAERAWILLDLAMAGSDPARELATRELGEALADSSSLQSVTANVLADIARALSSGLGDA